jgi:hypothetical protein
MIIIGSDEDANIKDAINTKCHQTYMEFPISGIWYMSTVVRNVAKKLGKIDGKFKTDSVRLIN